MKLNPAWAAIAVSLLLAIMGAAVHIVNYVLEQDTMTRVEIEQALDDERAATVEWVERVAEQHDRDRAEIRESIRGLDDRVDNATVAISGMQASIVGIDVHVSNIRDDLREVKVLLGEIRDYRPDT